MRIVARRYSSEAALETLGAAFEDACKTLRDFQEVFSRELQRPSAESRQAAVYVEDIAAVSIACLRTCH